MFVSESQMDFIDRGIMWELHENCRISYQTLAKKYGLTANAVRGRINKMMETGIIDSFVVTLSVEMIDSDLMFALVHTDGLENSEEFIKRLGQSPMVVVAGLVACPEGGLYQIFAQYIKSEGLSELGSFIRNIQEVTRVEVLPILYPRGGKTKLTKADLRVLKILIEDARMPIMEIAKKAGFTSRRVRRILNHFQETNSIWTAVRWNLNASDYIQFLMRVIYDERAIAADELLTWLKDSFPGKYWDAYFVSTSPEVLVEFVVDNLRDVEQILRSMKKMEFIRTASPLLRFSESKFPWLGEYYLRKMIAESESNE
jgi:DNA-binding Lrp family transcriptional regulator